MPSHAPKTRSTSPVDLRPSLQVILILLMSLAMHGRLSAADSDTATIHFNRDIRPILAENCYHCHGPDPGSRKAKLRFDRQEGFFAPHGKKDAAVVKGKPDESPLYQRITTTDSDDVMPPLEEKKVLTIAQKNLLRRWIQQGAPVEPHWAFIKPVRPALPVVKNTGWVRNPIDSFILARLEQAHLKPAKEADRRTLARRACLDITGLPPSPEQVDAFIADRSDTAYEKYVDRLFATPQYGEQRARYWLDAARYSDTSGQHVDSYREIWLYRDWVIAAFNRNEPFDQFTIEQVAGDLLPKPTQDQMIATGFYRCNVTTNEGGSIEEEALCNYARERAETTSWVWLGLTSNCAVCHDHKFDPIPTKDFYSLTAYFRNTTQVGVEPQNAKDVAPVIHVTIGKQEEKLQILVAEQRVMEKALDTRRQELRSAQEGWLKTLTEASWNALLSKHDDASLIIPLIESTSANAAISATFNGQNIPVTSSEKLAWDDEGEFGRALHLTEHSAVTVAGNVGDFQKDHPYTFGCWVKVPTSFSGNASIISRMDNDDGYRGWDLYLQNNRIATHLIHHWSDDALKVVTHDDTLKRGTWQYVCVRYDGSSKAAGLSIFVDGVKMKTDTESDTLRSTTHSEAPFFIGRRKSSDILGNAWIQDVRLYSHALSDADIAVRAFARHAKEVLAQAPEKRSAKDVDSLCLLHSSGDSQITDLEHKIAFNASKQVSMQGNEYTTLVMQDHPGSTGVAHVLFRGQYDQRKEEVHPGVLSALHPLPKDAPNNRLGLAEWLVSKDNALMPRVTVNRMWQQVFGTGIVKTTEDFGIMGDAPSHPELLDWLAVEFRDGGWNIKAMMRLIVTSAAYRQDSSNTKEKLDKDPENRLLSRGPRFRMDGEMVRDYALKASGLLSPTMGGPGVRPYQPDHVWDVVGLSNGNTRDYVRDHNEGLYRRSIYTLWKRMAPAPSVQLFDAPSREVSCLRRDRSNTPLQALVTLNDPQFVEAARVLAQHAMQHGKSDDDHLSFIAERTLLRPVTSVESKILLGVLDRLRKEYQAKPADAHELLLVGDSPNDPNTDAVELASWTILASDVLNLDETLNK